MKTRWFWLIFIPLLVSSRFIHAKCDGRQLFYCTSVVFKHADPKLKKSDQFPGHCAGLMEIKGIPTPVVFQDTGECPTDDTRLSGNLISICQDTGEWTQAKYWFANRPFYCGMSYKQRRLDARKITSRIFPNKTTRGEVRELLKEYEYIGAGFSAEFVEQYYGHPNTLVEVPFAVPGGQDEKVSGRATIADIEMPQP